MSIDTLKDYVFTSKYARYVPEKKRRETFEEAVERVMNMHRKHFKDKGIDVSDLIERCERGMKSKMILGSQRAMQFGGEPILRKNCRIFNCSGAYCDRPRFFQETLWILLCGSGAGFSVQKEHIAKLPKIQKVNKKDLVTHVVEDSIEGWADAIGALMSSYFVSEQPFPEYFGKNIEFDYSQVRPKGSPLSSGTSKAPGPDALHRSIDIIKELLNKRIEEGFDKLRSIDAYDIVMHSSDAVLSGGVRRAATICMFSSDDDLMAKAKTGNWMTENPQRARSNNSAVLIRGETTREQFASLMSGVKEFGEPGFVFSDDKDNVVNPCFSKDTNILTSNGWFTFGELLGKEDVVVAQDKRIQYSGDQLEDPTQWFDNKQAKGITYNKASSIRMTSDSEEVYGLETEDGHFVKPTKNHHFWVKGKGMTEVKDLVVGKDEIYIPVADFHEEGVDCSSMDYKKGFICGLVFGDGTFSDGRPRIDLWNPSKELIETTNKYLYEITGDNKELHLRPSEEKNNIYTYFKTALQDCFEEVGFKDKFNVSFILKMNKSMFFGFVSGLLNTDGCLETGKKKRCSVRISSINKQMLRNVQMQCQRFGVISSVLPMARKADKSLLPDGKGGKKEYTIKPCYRICFTGMYNIKNLLTLAPFVNKYYGDFFKLFSEMKKGEYKKRLFSKVKSIELVGIEPVYCLSENVNRTLIANGLTARRCGEVSMYPQIDDKSGFAFCNLCEINIGVIDTPVKFMEACELAAILGTLQADYTSFEYLGKVSEDIAKREALLGISMTGMMEHPSISFDPELQRKGAKLILDVNEKVAKKIGINPCARATVIKPSGTASGLLGTSSGIHPHHAKRYLRRAQSNADDVIVKHFQSINPMAVEKSVWSANGTDLVLSFCVEAGEDSITKRDVNALDLLKKVKLTKENWIDAGKRTEACAQPWLSHNVSNTISVKDEEWDEVEEYIYENRNIFAGISLLADGGDLDYPQAPFCEVLSAKELVEYYGHGAIFASGLVEEGKMAFDDNLWAACDAVLGKGEDLTTPTPKKHSKRSYEALEAVRENKLKWVEEAREFSDHYFGGDIKKMTRCLKRVSLRKIWDDLKRSYKPVDYTQLVEIKDTTKVAQTMACSGGTCEIL